MTISEYTEKWNRDPEDNLAAFTAHWLSDDPEAVGILSEITIEDADPQDMKEWGIVDNQEWFDAQKAALNELKR